jgi:hypothetical protein
MPESNRSIDECIQHVYSTAPERTNLELELAECLQRVLDALDDLAAELRAVQDERDGLLETATRAVEDA